MKSYMPGVGYDKGGWSLQKVETSTSKVAKRKNFGGLGLADEEKPPKKYRTSYILWSMEERKRIKDAEPDLAITVVGQKMGKKWSVMTEVERDVWNDAARKDKERWEREVGAYNERVKAYEEGVRDGLNKGGGGTKFITTPTMATTTTTTTK